MTAKLRVIRSSTWMRFTTSKRVQRCIREISLPASPQLSCVLDRVSLHRGREISLAPSYLRHLGLSGVWLDIGDRDLIAYETDASLSTQRYIICHEIGHMLLDHSALTISELARRHNLSDKTHLCTSGYNDVMEAEADAVACSLIQRLTFTPTGDSSNADLHMMTNRIAMTLQRSL